MAVIRGFGCMQRLAVPMVTWKTALPAVLAAVVLGIEPADASEASSAKPAPEVKPARAKPEKIVHPETTDPVAASHEFFDGGDTRNFPRGRLTSEKHLESGVTSVDLPADFTLHLEFRLSYMPTARGQYRSNSGVYLHNCYEVQVLDSFGLEGGHDECGGIYKVREPMVNMCFPPLVWQTYDIDFTAPRYDATGIKAANARVSVRHNGVPIHDNVEVPGSTPAARQKEGPPPRPLFLQGHGNHVQYRNVWLVERP